MGERVRGGGERGGGDEGGDEGGGGSKGGDEGGGGTEEGGDEDVDIGGYTDSTSSRDDDDYSGSSSSEDGDDDDDDDDDDDMIELEDVLGAEDGGGQVGDRDDDDLQILKARIRSLEDEHFAPGTDTRRHSGRLYYSTQWAFYYRQLYYDTIPEGQRAPSFSVVRGHFSSSRTSTWRTNSGGVMDPPQHPGARPSGQDPPIDRGSFG
ncbi:uncharacterized protein LOC131043688 [Cryptomeria japonica]|uniref:uncharacterized protein LOC131043688 n=1 Tax=Cryptomeria japonica TaxID=3369 RepID=UPI0027DA4D97|nr:uncharacterized protein LOC131043688 [Cryptomeria japonica]